MFAVSSTPSSSFSCAAGDGGLLLQHHHHHPQQQHRHRLCLDQAASSSSFAGGGASDGGLLQHHFHSRFEVASSPSSYSSLIRCCAGDGGLLLHHHHHKHGLSLQAATLFSQCVGKCTGYGGLLHHHGLRLSAATSPSSSSVGDNSSFLQLEQHQFCLTLPSPLSNFVCVGDSGLLQPQQTHRGLHAHPQQHLSLQEDQERLLREQQRQEVIQKHQTAILESISQHQASLQHSALVSTNSQIEPVASGYVPPSFDTSSCRSVFIGHVHHRVSEKFLAEVFSTVGPLASCKLIRKEKSSFGFVEYLDHRAAAVAISTLNGRQLFKLPIKVNWAYTSELREDITGHHTIFVGDLSTDVSDAELFKFFRTYPSCSDARVMWDSRSGRSKGFGFASFREREDAEKAIEEMSGKMLGSRAIRCNWATETESISEGSNGQGFKRGPKHDPRYTTVYVGNLAHEVTEEELQQLFDMLGFGVIEDVRVPKKKGFGFVRYSTHEEAALAIKGANGKIIGGKPLKCTWGNKRNSSETSSNSVPREHKDDSFEASSDSLPLAPPVLPIEESMTAEG
eukprot:c23780_g1_i1 orf=126-1820(+)